MLILLIRAISIYIILLVVLRLMGKRQLGEMQPFEFVIAMVIANLACIPIGDEDISILSGIIPIIVLFVLHFTVTKLSLKHINFRKLVNGCPIIIIDENGLNYDNMKRVKINTNDVMSGLRQNGYFSPVCVKFALIETNGKISVLPKEDYNKLMPREIPYMLISEGKLIDRNMELISINKEKITNLAERYNCKVEEIVILLVDCKGNFFLQPNNRKSESGELDKLSQYK